MAKTAMIGYYYIWQPVDVNGKHVPNGKVYTKSSLNPDVDKAVYADNKFSIPFPNPIELDAAGRPSIDSVGPKTIYLDVDPDNPTDLWKMIVEDCCGTIVSEIDVYPTFLSGGVTPTKEDARNHIPNGQFRLFPEKKIHHLTDSEEQIADSGWSFSKNNKTATDTIEFVEYPLGSQNPEFNPRYSFNYVCTAAGSGETIKRLLISFKDVISFEGQSLTFQFAGESSTNSTVEAKWIQDFGDGGSTDVPTVIDIFNLESTSSKVFHKPFVVPLTTGKSLGTANDRSIIAIDMPLNATCNIELTNFALTQGNQLVDYEYLTYEEQATISKTFELPLKRDSNDELEDINVYGTYMGSDGNGNIKWIRPGIGNRSSKWHGNLDPNELEANGNLLVRSKYPDLYNKLGMDYGPSNDSVNATAIGDYFTIENLKKGDVDDAVDHNTTFTIVVTQQGTPTLPEITKITCVPFDDLTEGTYFTFHTKGKLYAPFVKKNGSGTPPVVPGAIIFGVNTLTGFTAAQVAVQFATNIRGEVDDVSIDDAISAIVVGDKVTAQNEKKGSVSDAVDINTGWTITVIQQGSTGVEVTEITPTATAQEAGQYFEINSVEHNFYVDIILDGIENDPVPGGKDRIKLKLASTDTAEEKATKLAEALNSALFKLPDPRGYFFRAKDGGIGRDPDADKRKDRGDRGDGTTGDFIGTVQNGGVETHTHDNVTVDSPSGSPLQAAIPGAIQYEDAHKLTSLPYGGKETRAINIYVLETIKF